MTKYAARKKAARIFQQTHPDTTFPAALRAVSRPAAAPPSWRPGQAPWIRSAGPDEPVGCYFCGKSTAITSFGDVSIDTGRVELYCDNGACDAREVEVIVVDDGTSRTAQRTDVRILGRYGPTARPSWTRGVGPDWTAGMPPSARSTKAQCVCVFCGATSCVPARDDDPVDAGRMRLHCTNPRCSVVDVDVLVTRDGTGWPQDRQDVKALNAIDPNLAGFHGDGADDVAGIRIVPVSELHNAPEDLELQLRVSGPAPWER